MTEHGLDLATATTAVHLSPTRSYRLEADTKFAEAVERAFDELAAETEGELPEHE